jgi:catechol 2,3-dioxygenase-like lactoylglutathione lyase family enzyme
VKPRAAKNAAPAHAVRARPAATTRAKPELPTWGLTHVALAVRDLDRSFQFYRSVFGMVETHRGENFLQAQTPGTHDVLVLETDSARAGSRGGVLHFGFRLRRPADIGAAARRVRLAGGTIRERGEFVPGEPYLFFTDLDGYEVEVWYELPAKSVARGATAARRPASARSRARARPRGRAPARRRGS